MRRRQKRNTSQSQSAISVASLCERATESLEARQLLSATVGNGESEFCLEQRAAPQTIEDIRVLRESGSDGSPTIVWNDRLPEYDLLAGYEFITEYEVRLRNESLPVTFSFIALLDDATRFDSSTRTNTESLLRPVNSRSSVEVTPGQTERFSGSIDYELAPGIYSFSVRYHVLTAFGTAFVGSTSATPNALSSDWSEFSTEEKFTVAPEGESFFMRSPDATAKHTLFSQSIFSNTPLLAWGHVQEAESYELWISRDGPGRWSQALSVTIDGIVDVPLQIVGSITNVVLGDASNSFYISSFPGQVAQLTAEPLPTPAAPTIMSVVPNQSGGSGRQIRSTDHVGGSFPGCSAGRLPHSGGTGRFNEADQSD